jgi:ABC transport system ATP-binding/permease protein
MNEASYPQLYEKNASEFHPLDFPGEFIVGRSQNASLPIFDIECSRRQFKILFIDGNYQVEAISVNSPTYCNGRQVESTTRLSHGSTIKAGSSFFVFLEHEDKKCTSDKSIEFIEQQPTSLGIPEDAATYDRTMMFVPGNSDSEVELESTIPIKSDMLLGREKARVSICLKHPQVSRIHAQITKRSNSFFVSDLNSANGTFVNGKRINGPRELKIGDHIDIGPYALAFDGTCLTARSRVNNVELKCRNLSRIVKDRETGDAITILDDVSVVIQPREFVCLLGPSGSGKSTLLSALSARVPADHGRVSVNNEDLYTNFDALKRDIAVVPQKDVLHELLDVETALQFTAKLRLPPDTSADEISDTVSDMLKDMSLSNRGSTQICNLSGGQLKRASLANEILSKPSLLFLDEVTSGLDEQTDAEMMRLFREIADGGKTVVCVTHSLAHVEEFCHKVVILTEGGKLAFVGTPAEALHYFSVDRLGEIYKRLDQKSPEEWKATFLEDDAYKRDISQFLHAESELQTTTLTPNQITFPERFDLFARQTKLLTNRYFKIQWADKQSSLMMLGQCILVGFFLILLFGNISDEPLAEKTAKSGQIMFLIATSVFWFGCNNAAKEIVKERTIYSRERDVNLLVVSYVTSKCLLLGAASVIQATLLYLLVTFGTAVDTSIGQYILLLTLAFAGVNAGLLISSVSPTTDLAVTTVPLILIPQIVFAGAITAVEGLAKLVAVVFVINYWAYGGLATTLPSQLADTLGYEDWSALTAWLLVLFHALLYLVGVFAVLMISGSREDVYKKTLERIRTTKDRIRAAQSSAQ